MFFHVILTTECNLQCRYCFVEALMDFTETLLARNIKKRRSNIEEAVKKV